MTEQELVKQLKTLKNIHPDQSWVVYTRNNILRNDISQGLNLSGLFGFVVPRPLAISALAAVVVVVLGVSIIQEGLIESESSDNFASVSKFKSISAETAQELSEIAEDVEIFASNMVKTEKPGIGEYTVIFGEDADEQEKFKNALRDSIESKIGRINDLFAQLDDGDLALEISLNTRKFEENFEKLANEEIAAQVKILLEDAQEALDDGNLIDALDLVVAIERLLK